MCTKQFAGLLAPVLLALVVSCAREAEDIPGNSGGATGTGCDPGAADEDETWTVDEAKQICKFQLYWLGPHPHHPPGARRGLAIPLIPNLGPAVADPSARAASCL